MVNADALQVFACWRVLTARPSDDDLARAPHALYGHVPCDADYSAGHWLRDIAPVLAGPERPIIVGGTGLNFAALTDGLAPVPPVDTAIRTAGNDLTLDALIDGLDPETAGRIDLNNRARVQRAWEVRRATGRGLAAWQAETPPPLLPLTAAQPLLLMPDKTWLNARIAHRFDLMLEAGALDEARAALPDWDPSRPSAKAIGARELISHLRGELDQSEMRELSVTATQQYAKRQRTWFRGRMSDWHKIDPATDLSTE